MNASLFVPQLIQFVVNYSVLNMFIRDEAVAVTLSVGGWGSTRAEGKVGAAEKVWKTPW